MFRPKPIPPPVKGVLARCPCPRYRPPSNRPCALDKIVRLWKDNIKRGRK